MNKDLFLPKNLVCEKVLDTFTGKLKGEARRLFYLFIDPKDYNSGEDRTRKVESSPVLLDTYTSPGTRQV